MLDQSPNSQLLVIPRIPESSRVPLVGIVRQHHHTEKPPTDSDDGVNNKEPSPSGKSGMPVHRPHDGSLQSSRQHIPDRLTAVIKSHAFGKLRGCVPVHEESHHTRPSAALECSEEDSNDINLFGGRHHRHQPCEDAPANFESRKPERRSDIGHDDLGRNQHNAVCDVECGREVVELIAVEGEILFHAGDISILQDGQPFMLGRAWPVTSWGQTSCPQVVSTHVDILLIEILDHLRDTSKGHQEYVKPSHKLSLFFRSLRCWRQKGWFLCE